MIPLASTTITVQGAALYGGPGSADEYVGFQDATASTVTGVRAHLSSPGVATEQTNAPALSVKLTADPCPLEAGDRVVDESTGRVYDVQWAHHRTVVFPHVQALLWLRASAGEG